MLDRLLSYLEKRPREFVIFVLTFCLAVTSVSGLCFYVLNEVWKNDREVAQAALAMAKYDYESKLGIMKERSRVSAENITRVTNTLVPLLKAEEEELKSIREQFASTPSTEVSLGISNRLVRLESEIGYLRLTLETEHLVAIQTVTTSPVSTNYVVEYLLPRLMWSCIAVGVICGLLLFWLPRKKRLV